MNHFDILHSLRYTTPISTIFLLLLYIVSIAVGGGTLWGEGGVASLQRIDSSMQATTFGSVLQLTLEQLHELFVYEGGYNLHSVTCDVHLDGPSSETTPMKAVTFVCRKRAFVNPPCEQYLTAIHHHLEFVWERALSISIIGYDDSGSRMEHGQCQYPEVVILDV